MEALHARGVQGAEDGVFGHTARVAHLGGRDLVGKSRAGDYRIWTTIYLHMRSAEGHAYPPGRRAEAKFTFTFFCRV